MPQVLQSGIILTLNSELSGSLESFPQGSDVHDRCCLAFTRGSASTWIGYVGSWKREVASLSRPAGKTSKIFRCARATIN